jgi:hypothetical protein
MRSNCVIFFNFVEKTQKNRKKYKFVERKTAASLFCVSERAQPEIIGANVNIWTGL